MKTISKTVCFYLLAVSLQACMTLPPDIAPPYSGGGGFIIPNQPSNPAAATCPVGNGPAVEEPPVLATEEMEEKAGDAATAMEYASPAPQASAPSTSMGGKVFTDTLVTLLGIYLQNCAPSGNCW